MSASRSTLFGIVLIIAAIALAWPAVSEFLAVDECLDSGGSFNYAMGVCDFQRSHLYAPSPSRSPWLIFLGGVLLAAGILAVLKRGRHQ